MKSQIKILSKAILSIAILALSACTTHKDLIYMQNDRYGQSESILNLNKIKVQPQDQLRIIVSCKEPKLASLFNLKDNSGSNSGTSQLSYTVDDNGDINFPELGKIHISGLTRDEISTKIADLLIKGEWISDPIVTVEFSNLHFSAIGAVGAPGTYSITNDKLTLLEALSMAGDLSNNGEREIIVIREQNGKRIKHLVDLRDNDIFDSPVFYIQQNDVIYVKPDEKIARQAADNPNDYKSLGMWFSILSFLMTTSILIFK